VLYSLDLSSELVDSVDFYESIISLRMPLDLDDCMTIASDGAVLLSCAALPADLCTGQDMRIAGRVTLTAEQITFLQVVQRIYTAPDVGENTTRSENGLTLKRQLGAHDPAKNAVGIEARTAWPPGYCDLTLQAGKISVVFDTDHLRNHGPAQGG